MGFFWGGGQEGELGRGRFLPLGFQRGMVLGPQQWKRSPNLLTTGKPGNSLHLHFKWNEELLAKKLWPFQRVLKWKRENTWLILQVYCEKEKALFHVYVSLLLFLNKIRIYTKMKCLFKDDVNYNAFAFFQVKNHFSFLEQHLHQDREQTTLLSE